MGYDRGMAHAEETHDLLLSTLSAEQRDGSTMETLRSHAPKAGPALPRLGIQHRRDRSGDYELRDVLGKGASGEVFSAMQHSLRREVAVKRMRDDVTTMDPGGLVREARILGKLEHPNVVPVYALGSDPTGRPAFAMKRVEGVPWRSLIRYPEAHRDLLGGRSPLEAHVDILRQLCGALARAHSLGILHLDVKPDNVMVGAFGEVYLVDWGVAAASRPGTIEGLKRSGGRIIGTPAYFAPEQARAEDATEQTDVYLLGACLYEVLTGRPPRSEESVTEAVRAASRGHYDPLPDTGTGVLHILVRAAMAVDPAQRPRNAMAFATALTEGHAASLAETLVVGAEASAHALIARLDDGDATEVAQLLSDARRGYEAALNHAPHYKRAKEGLQWILRVVAREELKRGQVEQAKALVAADPQLAQEMAPAIEAAESARRERAQTAEERRWLKDLARGRHRRLTVLSASWAAVVLVAWWAVGAHRFGQAHIDYPPMILTLTFLVAVGGLLLPYERGAARRRVLGNLTAFAAGAAQLMLFWGAGWPAAAALTAVLWTAGTAGLVVALTADRHLLPAALWIVTGAVAAVGLPDIVWEVAAASMTLAALSAVLSEFTRSTTSQAA